MIDGFSIAIPIRRRTVCTTACLKMMLEYSRLDNEVLLCLDRPDPFVRQWTIDHKKWLNSHNIKVLESPFKDASLKDQFGTANASNWAWQHASKEWLMCMDDDMYCFSSDTPLWTNKSISLIESPEGKFVMTHKGEFKAISGCFKRRYIGKMMELNISHLGKFLVTPSHPIKVAQVTSRFGNFKLGRYLGYIQIPYGRVSLGFEVCEEWKKAGDIKPNLFAVKVLIPKERVTVPSQDDFEFFGWYLAEGFGSYDKEIRFSLNRREKNYAKRIVELGNQKGFSSYYRVLDKEIRVSVWSKLFLKFLRENFGHSAKNKFIPQWVIEAEKPKLKAFIDAWEKGDGYKQGKKEHVIITASRKLAYSAFLAFLKLGIVPSIMKVKSPSRKWGITSTCYRIQWSNSPTQKTYWIKDGALYLRVKGNKTIPFNGYVYNLSVQETETYCVPFIVHNCSKDWDFNLARRIRDTSRVYVPINVVPEIAVERTADWGEWYHLTYPRELTVGNKYRFTVRESEWIQWSEETKVNGVYEEPCSERVLGHWMPLVIHQSVFLESGGFEPGVGRDINFDTKLGEMEFEKTVVRDSLFLHAKGHHRVGTMVMDLTAPNIPLGCDDIEL